jgi:hypothetical protein
MLGAYINNNSRMSDDDIDIPILENMKCGKTSFNFRRSLDIVEISTISSDLLKFRLGRTTLNKFSPNKYLCADKFRSFTGHPFPDKVLITYLCTFFSTQENVL